jgi:GDP-4-dehydro-6-deoxy-D-mannose reductase
MNAVVTGSSGLLGHEIARALGIRGIKPQPLRARFAPEAATEFLPVGTSELASALRDSSPQYVFHLAGISTAGSIAEFYRVNTLYAAVLLDALEVAGLAQTTLVLVGSAAEYGPMDQSILPAREDGPTHPVDFYGASKLAQTCLGVAAARKGRRVVVVRPSNIIGPRMPRHLAIGSFAHQLGAIARGQRDAVLQVGDLSASRDLIDVCDAAELIVRLAETPAATGHVVNVSTGRAVSMFDVVQTLLRMFERNGRGRVRIEHREIAGTAASSKIHFSCNRRLVQMLGSVEYTPLEKTLAGILDAELSNDQPNRDIAFHLGESK